MAGYNTGRDLEDVVAQTFNDVKNLECQIRNLLRSMDVVDSIANAPILSLPERLSFGEGEDKESIARLQWGVPEDSRKQRKGKTIPESKTSKLSSVQDYGGRGLEDLSDLDIMEMCINDKVDKYVPVPESVFFAPVLDRCIFGITLLNAGITKLSKPKISLSVLPPCTSTDEQPGRKAMCRCFFYDVQVSLKEVSIDKADSTKTEQGLAHQESFSNYLDLSDQVMPGCEVLVTATFPYPSQFLRNGSDFSLLLSANLDGRELWVREVPITSDCFTAARIDAVFKDHHSDVMAAIAKEHEIFKMERLLSPSEMTPYKSMERFLVSHGYVSIQSVRTGADITVEVYTTNQPSLLWGTCFKMEKCSRKPSLTRCLVTARTKDQMLYIFKQLQCWLHKEGQKDRQHGLSRITVSPINARNNITICEKLQAEIDLIIKFQQVKSILREERESGRTAKRKADRYSDTGSIDSSWIHEYCISVERTDMTFVNKI